MVEVRETRTQFFHPAVQLPPLGWRVGGREVRPVRRARDVYRVVIDGGAHDLAQVVDRAPVLAVPGKEVGVSHFAHAFCP